MRDYKEGRAERNMTTAKKDMIDRIQKLESKAKLTSGMQSELQSLKTIIENYNNLDIALFEEIPGDGLPCDWIEKLSK